MKIRRIGQALLGLMGLIVLLLGLTACSPQEAPAVNSPSTVQQTRNITVYESPT